VSASWSIGRLWLRAGDSGPLRVIDREDGPSGRTVCLIPGHLAWQAPDGLRAALVTLVAWSARTGHGDARPWQDARALLDAPRNPHAED